MIQTFTLNDVVRYVYHEMNSLEADRMQEALLLDSELMDFYQQLTAVKRKMEATSIDLHPSTQTIHRILNYSRSYHLQETDL